MGGNLFGQRFPDNRGSTVVLFVQAHHVYKQNKKGHKPKEQDRRAGGEDRIAIG